jgi:hypothetical protein
VNRVNRRFDDEQIKNFKIKMSKMDDQTKLSLFDALLAYLFQSSSVMDDTAKALAPDPLQAARVDVLNDALISARVMLSKVSIHALALILLLLDFLAYLL